MRTIFVVALFALLCCNAIAWVPNDRSTTGGTNCAGCTLAVGILDQVAVVNKMAISDLVGKLCSYFKDPVKETCEYFVDTFGQDVVSLLASGVSPDDVCLKLKFCKNPTCKIFTNPLDGSHRKLLSEEEWNIKPAGMMRTVAGILPHLKSTDGSDPFQWIKDLVNNIFDKHLPGVDIDGDRFSLVEGLRGSDWRGKDCDDGDNTVYPGRKSTSHPDDVDHDCNGIKGTDPASGKSYEDLYCADTPHYGIVVLGDSASAHFHIPPEYMNASAIRPDTYNTVFDIASDEIDWPMLSTVTGHVSVNDTLHCPGPVDSIYMRMRERNRCIHRDYQNIAVNGADMGSMNDTILPTLARDQQNDHPLLVFLLLIGNDVCNGHIDTLGDMTSVDKYRDELLSTLEKLDNMIPAGSHVVLGGTADGNLLYKYLHDQPHPIGATTTITYKQVYQYLSCLGVSPCEGWMNDNDTVRELTTARNMAYDKVYQDLVSSSNKGANYTNFDLIYLTSPLLDILTDWDAEGKNPAELIEPVDGFHPGQIAQALEAKWMYEHLEEAYPEFLGEVNPHNDDIQKVFGDQGGY